MTMRMMRRRRTMDPQTGATIHRSRMLAWSRNEIILSGRPFTVDKAWEYGDDVDFCEKFSNVIAFQFEHN